MRGDLKVIGPQAAFGRYLVAGGTAIEAGEPVENLGVLTSGVTNVNTHVLAAEDIIVLDGSQRFGGIAIEESLNASAGTVLEQFLNTANPVPSLGRIRGAAETSANVDTLSELALLLGDYVLIDYNSSGGADGGELYTIKDAAASDTSAFELIGGNPALSTLDITVAHLAYRNDVT